MKRILALSFLFLAPQIITLDRLEESHEGGPLLMYITEGSLFLIMHRLNASSLRNPKEKLEGPAGELYPTGVWKLVQERISDAENNKLCSKKEIEYLRLMTPAIIKAILRAHLEEKKYEQALQELYDADLLKKPNHNNCEKELKELKKMLEVMASKQ